MSALPNLKVGLGHVLSWVIKRGRSESSAPACQKGLIVTLHSALQIWGTYEILHSASECFRQLVDVSHTHVRQEDVSHFDPGDKCLWPPDHLPELSLGETGVSPDLL